MATNTLCQCRHRLVKKETHSSDRVWSGGHLLPNKTQKPGWNHSSHVGDDLLYRTKQTFQGYIGLRVVCLSSVTLPDSRALAKSVCDCVTITRAAKCERRSHNESGCGCRHARAPARARPTPIHHVQSQKICVPGRPAARPGPCTHCTFSRRVGNTQFPCTRFRDLIVIS